MKHETLQLNGAGYNTSRRALDYYPTPPEVTVALLRFLKLPRETKVWEPACGKGSMSKVLELYFDEVTSSDIMEGNYGNYYDFLSNNGGLFSPASAIITNPPFNLSERFITKALTLSPVVAMLLKSQYWHAEKRRQLFLTHPPAYVLPLTWRPDFLFDEREAGKKGKPTMEVLWTVWIDGHRQCHYRPIPKPEMQKGVLY